MSPRSGRGGSRRAAAPPPPRPAPLPRAATALVAAVVAACIVRAVTFALDDGDVWQHLAVGRALWTLRAVPRTDLWTWPLYGTPYLLPSWLFRSLLWPCWAAGGAWGLEAWRVLTALAAFALAWATARRMGARGLVPLVVIAWCAMFHRQRSQMRPDTLVCVLLALEAWLLERWRGGARVSPWWLVAIVVAWINAHLSYYLFFVLGGAYLLDAIGRARRGGGGPAPRPLALALTVCVPALLLNPFGLAAVRQPFEFALAGQHEPIFRSIVELRPPAWDFDVRNGLAVFLVLWPLLAVARWWRRGVDVAELVLLPALVLPTLGAQRFMGYLAVGAAPFVARDIAELLGDWRRPAWAGAAWARTAGALAACALVTVPELTRPEWPARVGFNLDVYPVAACDWIAAHAVRGRAFNVFDEGGYLLWRFWPERARLPFIDIHQSVDRADRDLYTAAMSDPDAWRALDAKHHFDWVLLPHRSENVQPLLDQLDGDPQWALVFLDDVSALWVRRTGPLAPLARAWTYAIVPAGRARLAELPALLADPRGFAAAQAELRRQVEESPRCGQAHSQLANLAGRRGDWALVLRELAAARALDPRLPALDAREALARRMLAGR